MESAAESPPSPPLRGFRPLGLGIMQLMIMAIVSLSTLAACSVMIQSFIVSSSVRFGTSSTTTPSSAPAAPEASSAAEPPTPAARLASSTAASPAPSEDDLRERFLEKVKRRVKYKTPLDDTFWRPYARPPAEGGGGSGGLGGGKPTNLIFVAGAEGTGHHFVTAVMMRLQQLWPMTIVQASFSSFP